MLKEILSCLSAPTIAARDLAGSENRSDGHGHELKLTRLPASFGALVVQRPHQVARGWQHPQMMLRLSRVSAQRDHFAGWKENL